MAYNELYGLPEDDEDQYFANGALVDTATPTPPPDLSAVRAERDNDIALANLTQGISQIGAGLAGQKADTKAFDAFRQQAALKAGDALTDAKLKAKAVADFIANRRAAEKDKQNEDYRSRALSLQEKKLEADNELRRAIQGENNAIKSRALDIKEKEFAQKAEEKKDAVAEKGTAGQVAVDKDYAKHYNDFSSRGVINSAASIEKLKKIADEMEADTGLLQSGGGRFASVLPDVARSRDAIRRRDDARNAANSTLKELFGGQLSDAEREAAAREYYNDALDNTDNSKLLRGKIAQLEGMRRNEMEKAKHYEANGSLRGFKIPGADSVAPATTSSNKPPHILAAEAKYGVEYEKGPDGWHKKK